MEPFKPVKSKVVPLNRADVDTDQIIPAQYMKRIERTGYGQFLFDAWRKDPNFILNDHHYQGAKILVAGRNFGS
ncbi:MAG TPA: 3-isopropylmalate dehydratase small subunit, partial [Dehalococcoidia bacterium]